MTPKNEKGSSSQKKQNLIDDDGIKWTETENGYFLGFEESKLVSKMPKEKAKNRKGLSPKPMGWKIGGLVGEENQENRGS